MRRLWTYFIVGAIATAGGSAFAGGLPGNDSAASGGSTEQATPAATASSDSGSSTASGTSQAASSTESTTTTTTTDTSGTTQTASAASDDGGVETGSFIAIEDDPLIIDASSVVDGDGVGSMQVQWQISENGASWSNLSGEIRQSFTPRERHVGRYLRVQLSYVDGQGNLETILSPPSSPVQNVNDKPNGAPQLVGAAREEDALVVDTSMISDDDGLGNFSIIWQRSSTKTEWQAFPETNGEVLQLSQRHVGYSYRAVVSYEDGHGTKELLVTSPSETVQNVDDPVQGEVLITGEPTEGETILVSTNGVSDEDGIASMSVGWEASTDGRTWRAIETAGATQLALSQTLVNKQIRARVAVVDSFGVETVIFSQATNTVRNVNNKPAGTIFVRRVGG
ncbi:MAG TPA: hypothetical protein DGU02_02915 [Alphaproteobacteria bacterium]|jgi:hypothetical protein|nr:MAG: hypothetical protein CNE93_07590 [SAR116 cluster bacterium MED-G06]HCV88118.1 hypothetical protein [Alphaproteobacteria bacterium]|tara:strand:- start:2449 stop:3633 length:1185 start_codon:yes stop_codon:yes gene_type:complete